MNKIIYFIASLMVVLVMTSCNDFLNLTPQGTENSENYFNNENNAIYALNGVYDMLQLDEGSGPDGDWMSAHLDFFVGDLISDDAERGSNDSEPVLLLQLIGGTGSSSMDKAEAFWVHGFWGVSRANYVIEGLQEATWNEELRNRLMGEALFLRAYFNWYLVRMFGPIPLFTTSVQPSDFGKVTRSSVNEVYTQIADDLNEAARLLPTRSQYGVNDMGRATSGAAKSLLARVYMYQIGTDPDNSTVTWNHVYDLTKSVIDSREYTLLKNYALLWEEENENSRESVFEIQFGEGSEEYAPGSIGTNFYQYQGNRGKDGNDVTGWGHNNPTKNLVEAFEDGDPRLSCTVYGETFNNGVLYGKKRAFDRSEQGSEWLNRKAALPEVPAIQRAASRNIYVLRYADVLLMNAEAAYHIGGKEAEALSRLEEVRKRARESSYCKGYAEGKNDYNSYPASTDRLLPKVNATGDALLQAIWQERRVELAMESLRFYDLVRTGRFLDVMENEKEKQRAAGGRYDGFYSESINKFFYGIRGNLAGKCLDGPNGNKVYVLPIPLKEQQGYGLTQNPGYF